ncbi:proopiomelanocortin a [Boleophthalmus pectinirostris]|uniref:proopiomelanocortin a n=1 Tax=Boleophthalmus pectinirostris TaxID=150288 RepID=UPI00242F2F29|nr:proopiomelanocortin a [Boleophthalmus pectinirostris]
MSQGGRVMCPAWLLVAVVVGGISGAVSQCWDHPSCRDLDTNLQECIQVCRSDLSAEMPVIPGPSHLQAPPPPLSDSALSPDDSALSVDDSAPQTKRSYSMEHFRWGKPVGRKRRPVKVYTNGVEDDSVEVFPGEMKRALSNQDEEAGLNQEVLVLENDAAGAESGGVGAVLSALQQKKNSGGGGAYKMKHFRWSGPPESKRYGGFMKNWDERSQKPLLTLFKNVINKNPAQTQHV